MRSLPTGNYALCIAHPGHELRLHGFLEQAKPFVWILTDGSERTGEDMIFESNKTIDKATKQGLKINIASLKDDSLKKLFTVSFTEDHIHVKDIWIYEYLLTANTDFFVSFINFIADNIIKYKIDYLISDASEHTNVCHEAMIIMSNIAIEIIKKKTGKSIMRYCFSIDKPYKENINDDTIHIKLDDDAIERKLDAILKYPLAITDLKPNVVLDNNMIIEFMKMPIFKDQIKHLLKEINIDFFSNEYLNPVKNIHITEDIKYEHEITYQKHLIPLQEKLRTLIFGNAN